MFLSSYGQFNVDIWLCYGSFFYGFESHIYDAQLNSLKIIPKIEADENPQEFFEFMEAIIDKPKGLVKVEMRIYCPEKIERKFKFTNPLHLYSDVVPKIYGHEQGLPIIDFSFPQGMTYTCTDLWTSLLAAVFKVR